MNSDFQQPIKCLHLRRSRTKCKYTETLEILIWEKYLTNGFFNFQLLFLPCLCLSLRRVPIVRTINKKSIQARRPFNITISVKIGKFQTTVAPIPIWPSVHEWNKWKSMGFWGRRRITSEVVWRSSQIRWVSQDCCGHFFPLFLSLLPLGLRAEKKRINWVLDLFGETEEGGLLVCFLVFLLLLFFSFLHK